MNPKEEILKDIDDPQAAGWLASYLDLYAHKLAEQQRRFAEDTLDYDAVIEPGQLKSVVVAAVSVVADLIDPKVQT